MRKFQRVNASPAATRLQRGVALFVVMILLLVMTIIGVASMRGTMLEERMAGNLYDRAIMFQAAESALREAEARVSNVRTFEFTPGCDDGLCTAPEEVAAGSETSFIERWLDEDFEGWVNGSNVTSGVVSVTPEYFIELMGMFPNWAGCDQVEPIPVGCMGPRFRITARAEAAGRAAVLLQTAYTSPE